MSTFLLQDGGWFSLALTSFGFHPPSEEATMEFTSIFEREVTRCFRFLVADFGYADMCSKSKGLKGLYTHRYELEEWFIEPFYSAWDNEVNVDFGTSDEGPFSLHMYLGTINPTLYYELGASIAKSEADVVDLLLLYANALKVHCRAVLCRDTNLIPQMKAAATSGAGLCPPYNQQPEGRRIVSRFR